MALSPNYGFPEPDNSSLVKNGAQDMRALGDAIDTSVWNVGFGQAGKNKFINGDFSINQRGFTSTTATATYMEDRWESRAVGDGTTTHSIQTFTPGTAPVAGYEGKNFHRIATTGQTLATVNSSFTQKIESVRVFAGQTVTLSFWAKAASGTPNVVPMFFQYFGSGGSPSASVSNTTTKQAITTSWARYSFTVTLGSIAGKTLGTDNNDSLWVFIYTSAGSDLNASTDSLGIQTNTIDFWGMQIEYGSKATPFQTATGTIQGELAACQRYYVRYAPGANNYAYFGNGTNSSTTNAYITIPLPVEMRVIPTSVDTTTASLYRLQSGSTSFTVTSLTIGTIGDGTKIGCLSANVSSGLTTGGFVQLLANFTTSAFVGFSAEL